MVGVAGACCVMFAGNWARPRPQQRSRSTCSTSSGGEAGAGDMMLGGSVTTTNRGWHSESIPGLDRRHHAHHRPPRRQLRGACGPQGGGSGYTDGIPRGLADGEPRGGLLGARRLSAGAAGRTLGAEVVVVRRLPSPREPVSKNAPGASRCFRSSCWAFPKGAASSAHCLDVEQLTVHLAITAPTAACPVCGSDARRVRSRYTGRLRGPALPRPASAAPASLSAASSCPRSDCPRRIFAERLPGFAAPRAQDH